MIQVISVYNCPERYQWEFQGKRYPTLTIQARLDGEKDSRTLEISSESLNDKLEEARESRDFATSLNAKYLDNHIYAFIPDDLFKKSDEEIMRYIDTYLD